MSIVWICGGCCICIGVCPTATYRGLFRILIQAYHIGIAGRATRGRDSHLLFPISKSVFAPIIASAFVVHGSPRTLHYF